MVATPFLRLPGSIAHAVFKHHCEVPKNFTASVAFRIAFAIGLFSFSCSLIYADRPESNFTVGIINSHRDSPQPDSTAILYDTTIINEQLYVLVFEDTRFKCLLSIMGDTIIPSENFYFKLDVADFDGDNYTDIRVYIMSNTPNQCDNYLYDSKTMGFKMLQNCGLDFTKIWGKNYYYTHFREGCAGMNFGSHLGKIENFIFEEIAYIAENGCDSDTINFPQNYTIYKVPHNHDIDMELLQIFPYNNFEGIEKYWRNNCEKLDENQ